ncbi:S8 family serine peptidase [Candidatus Cyanaurora vandensis]|uniref:S8 family serine peptidase n=1 Tax=Candidatus Cyanaurora vandensis TaxID=2714958 RepID=UPI00257973ED|nr:S8 family serine peptidase [Candidatus Cyanaurora vandensis]
MRSLLKLQLFKSLLYAPAVLGLLLGFTPAAAAQTVQGPASPLQTIVDTSRPPMTVMLQLSDRPAALVWAELHNRPRPEAVASTRAQRARIEAAQRALLPTLNRLGATVLYRIQNAYNGIAVRVTPEILDQLRELPGVTVRDLPAEEPNNASGIPLIGAPIAWSAGLGNRGEGIKIGIIDTGIDYMHTNFGGPGLTGYPTNNTTVAEDTPGIFPGKVAGGYDFAGDAYNASGLGTTTPVPDADPMDCNGHGSHVAGTAAGYGVNSDGTTYGGVYNTSTPFSTLTVGPGVAPLASLYAIRVFGCVGSTTLTPQGINWAIDPNGDGDFSDRLDVINMSLGSSYGDPENPSAVASDNAAAAGIIVVASAGNSGDLYYVSGSPGSSGQTITVASSVDATTWFAGFQVNAGPLGLYKATEAAFGPQMAGNLALTPPVNPVSVTADLLYPTTNQDGCATYTPGTFTGKIAVIDRGTCTFKFKAKSAQDAGAVGVLLVNNSAGDPIVAGDDTTITTPITIPVMMVGLSDGPTLKGTGINGTLTAAYRGLLTTVNASLTDTLSSFSSRGPRLGGSALKPDLTAVGDTVFSTANGTGTVGTTLSGTSMAAPHVAGSAALLRQLLPTWTVEEIKALLMNTATTSVLLPAAGTTTPLVSVGAGRVGTGRINVQNAIATPVIAYNADEPGLVSVSFGAPEVLSDLTLSKTVKVVNKGNTPVTYTLGYLTGSDVPGVSFSYPPTVEIPTNSTITFPVTLTATAALMKHTRDITVSATQGIPPFNARHWLSEENGVLTLTPTSGIGLRLSLYAAPRPVADMGTVQTFIPFTAPTGTVMINSSGTPVDTGTTYPTDIVSLVKPLELQYTSFDEPTSTGLGNSADLKAVGVNSDYSTRGGSVANTVLSFGIATHSPWSNPIQVAFNILIDNNRDGVDDYLVNNLNLGGTDIPVSTYRTPPTNTSAFVAYLINGLPASAFDTGIFNNAAMVLPVRAGTVGLTDTNSRFNYKIQAFQRGVLIEETPTLTYDAARPGLDTSGGTQEPFLYFDRPITSVPVVYDQANYAANQSKGLLMLHLHNRTPFAGPGFFYGPLPAPQAQILPIGIQPQAIRAKVWQLVGSADFNADGKTDLLWRNYTTGASEVWFMDGYTFQSSTPLPPVSDLTWQLVGAADLTNDGQPDLVWRNFVTGENAIWQLDGTNFVTSFLLGAITDLNWQLAGTGDLTNDGKTDLIWRNYQTGDVGVWQMDGYTYVNAFAISTLNDPNWVLAGSGDLTGDGKPDLLWRNYVTGENGVWQMDGYTYVNAFAIGTVADLDWQLVGAGELTGDGATDLLWRNRTTGENGVWQMNGYTFVNSFPIGSYPAN